MPRRVKYRQLPSPLADEEKEVGATYYSEANRRAIVRYLPPKPDFDTENLFRTIEERAAFYVSWASEEPNHLTKFSDARRRFEALWAALGKLIEDQAASEPHPTERNNSRRLKRGQIKLAKIMSEITASPDLREYCRTAAENVADRERCLPDFPADLVPIEGSNPAVIAVWPVERQIAKATETIGGLAWLRRVAAEAASLAQQEIELAADRAATAMKMKFRIARDGKEIDQLKVEPAGQRVPTRLAGNRADEPLHWLIRVLVELYCANVAQPLPQRPRVQDNLTELSNSRQEREREAARLRAQAKEATTERVKARLVKLAQDADQAARALADQSVEIRETSDGLLGFLSACLSPLGVHRKQDALRKLCRRANAVSHG